MSSTLDQLMLERQSCRRFDPNRPVEKEKLVACLEAARIAPSACNSQPWSFIVVTDKEMAKKTAACLQDMGMNRFTDNCPAFTVIVEEKASLTETVGIKFKDQDFVGNDLGLTTAYYTLKATELGLSTCIIGWLNEKKLRALLGIPEKKRVRLVLATGYAEEGYPVRNKKRKDFDDIVRFI